MVDTMKSLGDEYWQFMLESAPTFALMLGYHDYGDRHEDYSREAEDAKIARLRDLVARAEALDPTTLDAGARTSREVLIFEAGTNADVTEHRAIEHGVSHTVGDQALLPNIPPQLPIVEPEHADNLVAKYQAIGRAFDQHTERLQAGLAAGKAPIASTVAKTIEQFDEYLGKEPGESFFTQVRVPEAFDEAQAATWLGRLAEVVATYVYPAMRRHRDLLHERILEAGRSDDEPGVMHLPGGDEYYATAVRRHTSLDTSAEEIHRIGLEQVARLDDEYRALGSEVLGTTDLPEIYRRLRDDPDLHFETGPDVIAASETAMAKAKAAIPEWFGRLPKADCRVAETQTGPEAFYLPPTPDGSRPGTFFVNTKDPSGWGRFQIEAMAYHEGIPGHHMQLAIAQELEDQPEFRKHVGITAYAEGWGLYTERLADEMGLYSSPLDRIGMLAADSLRAGRLVVDTGMHAMGWTRQQAIDFFADNSPMTMTSIRNEVDRYISMPGQALAYMIGRLEIMRMRAEAEKAMGDRFDIKGFHDTVLGDGMVPLGTLDRLVREWAAA
jgi:uncharacterized protein (DUF885 family)